MGARWGTMAAAALIGAAALAGPAGTVRAADGEDVVESFRLQDTQALVTACSVPADHAMHARANAFCLGYMSGAMHFYGAAVKSPKVEPFVCPPGEVSRAEVRKIFLNWAAAHPERLDEPPIEGLVRAAVAAFPCGKEGSKS